MTQAEQFEWMSDVWQLQAQVRTQAMGVLSTPSDSALFADAMLTHFTNRFQLTVTEPSAEEPPK